MKWQWKTWWLLLVAVTGSLLWHGPAMTAPTKHSVLDLSIVETLEYLCTHETVRRPDWCPEHAGRGPTAWVNFLQGLPYPLPALQAEALEAPEGAVTQFTYAYVASLPAATYTHPAEAEAGLEPLRRFIAGDHWVSLMSRTEYNGETWYEINPGEFINAAYLRYANPSRFRGVMLQEQPQYPFGWINRATRTASQPGGELNGPTVSRYQLITIYAQEAIGASLWYMIAQDQWVEQSFTARVSVSPRPEGVAANEKWIEVNTFEQILAAYEGDRMVFATLISSGRRDAWTPNGLNRIWAKLPASPMRNPSVRNNNPRWYYLEDVEWTQYFFRDYALHTAYWHDSFGFIRSNGCINLTPLDARWLFDWTGPHTPENVQMVMSNESNPGTWVWVHMTPPIPALALGQ